MSDDDEQWDGELIHPDDSEALGMPLDDGFELLLTRGICCAIEGNDDSFV